MKTTLLPKHAVSNSQAHLQLRIDDLMNQKHSPELLQQVAEGWKADITQLRHSIIIEMSGGDDNVKKQVIYNVRQGLVEMRDEVYYYQRLLNRGNVHSPFLPLIAADLKKLQTYIERKWRRYCCQRIKMADSELLQLRCQLQQPLYRVVKKLQVLDTELKDALLEPLFHFMRTVDTHAITFVVAQRVQMQLSELEKAISTTNYFLSFTEEASIEFMLRLEYSSSLFILLYRQHLQRKSQRIADATARIAYVQANCAQLQQVVQEQSDGLLATRLLPWMEQYAILIEKQAAASASAGKLPAEGMQRVLYEVPGGVVAELHRMLMVCGIYRNTELLPLLETVAAHSELPFTRTPSGSYLYGEAKRKSVKYKEVLLRYLPLFKDYLNS